MIKYLHDNSVFHIFHPCDTLLVFEEAELSKGKHVFSYCCSKILMKILLSQQFISKTNRESCSSQDWPGLNLDFKNFNSLDVFYKYDVLWDMLDAAYLVSTCWVACCHKYLSYTSAPFLISQLPMFTYVKLVGC